MTEGVRVRANTNINSRQNETNRGPKRTWAVATTNHDGQITDKTPEQKTPDTHQHVNDVPLTLEVDVERAKVLADVVKRPMQQGDLSL